MRLIYKKIKKIRDGFDEINYATDDTSYDDAQFHRIKQKFIDGNKLYVHTI